jgi:hypothetical protein
MSGAGYEVSKADKQSAHQTVHFIDSDSPWSYEVSAVADETTKLGAFSDAQLGSFLSRPIRIQEYSWTPGGTRLFESFNPWADFFSNSDVKEKINRFRNLRCNLRLKVLINGNSFYYGRALLSYNPYLQDDRVTLNRSFFEQDIVQASQKPHIILDPTSSQGGELMLPFIWPYNYLDITLPGWFAEMGDCTIHDFDILRHANGGTDPITVSVFAWAENLTLAVPSAVQAQSGFADYALDDLGFPKPKHQGANIPKPRKKMSNRSNGDEFVKDGLISKPASALAKAADALTMIPVIAPYAKATSMVATRVGQVAKIFGYSRPQVLEDTRSYVPRYVGNMANSDAPEPLVKLSLDSKNELSIDTRLMGLGGHDELTINSIAQRPSFWRQFDWPETATADTLLTSFKIQPRYGREVVATPVKEIHLTSLAFASAPFECWQGTIKFRFNVVASEYHRGRLRIVYSPNTLPVGAIPFNQTYSTIVDISEDRDFEYEVKWADTRAWAKNDLFSSELALYSDSLPVPCGTDFDNGSITVYVVNELATPSLTQADVKVQIWVSAGDDFAVSVPSPQSLKDYSVFEQQAAIAPPPRGRYSYQSAVPPEMMVTSEDTSNSPTSVSEVASFAPGSYVKDNNQYLVYQGERIVSFREMLRRYQYHYSWSPSSLGRRLWEVRTPNFPFYRGWDQQGPSLAVDSQAQSSKYTYCNMTLLNYLTPAFVCRRGSMRYKAILSNADPSPMNTTFSVQRGSVAFRANAETVTNPIEGPADSSILDSSVIWNGGQHITVLDQNPVLEFEIPYYSDGRRFDAGRDTNYWAGARDWHQYAVELSNSVQNTEARIRTYVSIGEDFQLGMFVGAPVLYEYTNPEPV